MATREETLKKINDELEQMSDEELDRVAGGTCNETADDSVFLYEHGLVDDWHGSFHMTFHWNSDSAAVDSGWAKAGITCVTKWLAMAHNQYFVDGKEISRDEAYSIVSSKYNKIRKA